MENVRNYDSLDLGLGFDSYLMQLIESLEAKSICDIGGGRNPQLELEYVRERAIDYTVLDIAQEELDNAPAEYSKLRADIGSKDFVCEREFDFVFSRMVAEHIKDGEQFHRNVFKMLKPGGVAFHFFPTLYSLPFVVNRMIPEWLSDRVLSLVAPRDRVQHGKFPAYYSWTYGPTRNQIAKLESIGYEVVRYAAGFGHGYYQRLPVLRSFGEMLTRRFVRRPNYLLCSFAYLVMRRPDGQDCPERIPWPSAER